MNNEQLSYRGRKAQELLNDEVMVEALSGMRAAITQAWADCPIRDVEGQHELKLMMKLMVDFEKNLQKFINDGKMADFEISEARKRADLKGKVQKFY